MNLDIHRPVIPRPMRIYIMGPLTAKKADGTDDAWEISKNVARAVEVGKGLFLKGHWVYCPHAQTQGWFREEAPAFGSYERVVTHHDILGWIRLCDALFRLPGWQKSRGSIMEGVAAGHMGLLTYDDLEDVPTVEGWEGLYEDWKAGKENADGH